MLSEYEKFKLLFWKNWKIQLEKKKQLVIELLLPILFGSFLIIVRNIAFKESSYGPASHESIRYKGYNISCERYVYGPSVIVYSPSDNINLKELMEKVIVNFKDKYNEKNFTLVTVNDSKALEKYLLNNEVFIGVEFEDKLKDIEELPRNLKYSIRLESYYSRHTVHFQTKRFTKKPRDRFDNEGTDYSTDLFLCMQNSIDRSFMEIFAPNKILPDVNLKRFAEKGFAYDLHYEVLRIIVPLLLTVNYVFIVHNIIKEVAKERELSLKNYQQTIGFSKTLQWSAWFAKALSLNMIGITVWTIFLTQTIVKGIFVYSNPFLIWFYLFFVVSNIIWFSFFLSMFFSRAKIAALTGMTVWASILIPYFVISSSSRYLHEFELQSNFFWSLLPASGLGFGILTISALEVHEGGLNFTTLFLKLHENGLSMGYVMLASVLSSLLLIILIMNIEIVYPDNQKHKKWYYIFQYTWKKIFDKNPSITELRVENGANGVNDSIKVTNLTKIFKRNKSVIEDVSFKIPKNQITVLLGHIGSGKSTIMSILKGEFEPTSGKVEFFENFNPANIGVCSEKNEMFRNLTVFDQLIFTCRVRGFTEIEALKESRKYLDLLSLMPYRNNTIKTLPLEALRKLCVLNAVCGNVKVVLFDEPTNGLDATSQKQVWDLLREEKKTKTIVLASKCSVEVEAVADQIILLKNGKFQASGLLSQIKSKFGIGYRLVCTKNKNSESESITRCLKQLVPDIEIDKESDTSLIYILEESKMSKFPAILEVLENESENFGISQLKLYQMHLGDILIRKNYEVYEENDLNGTLSEEFGGSFGELEEHFLIGNNQMQEANNQIGFHLILSQLWVVISKKFYFLRYQYKKFLEILILSVVLITIFLYIMFSDSMGKKIVNQPEIKISLANYSKTNVYLQSDKSEFVKQYKSLVGSSQNIVNVSIDEDMDDVILKNGSNYVIGATLSTSNITGWYYNEFHHSSPLSLNLINQAILKTYFGQNYSITVADKPYMDISVFSNVYYADSLIRVGVDAVMFAILFISISLISTINVKERTSGMKLLQFNYGFNKFKYWAISFFVDAVGLFPVIFIFVILIFFIHPYSSDYSSLNEVVRFMWTQLLTLLQAVSLIYIFSTMFRKSLSLKMFFVIFNIVPFCLFGPLMDVRLITRRTFENLLRAVPFFNFIDSVDRYYYDSIPMIAMIYICIYMGILVLIEYRFFLLSYCYRNRTPPKYICADDMTSEVINEIDVVGSLTRSQLSDYGITFKSLSNSKSKEEKLNWLSLTVIKASCVGLICQNSKIRSSIFKMITGEERINFGDIFINGKSVKTEVTEALKSIGYCSKDCNLFKHMTGRENLKVLGSIKGIPKTLLDEEIKMLSEELGFVKNLDELVKGYSEINRKLLGLAVALIGNPQVIVLEEPINELDETTTQKVLKLSDKLRNDGKTILILSNNLLPYESICNKISIIANGEMKFVDSPDVFRDKYAKGLNVLVELNKQHSDNTKLSKIVEIKNFIQEKFINAKLRSEDSNSLTFNIILNNMRLSEAFRILEDLKTFDITRYSITENSLEHFMILLNS